jgi:uncharacterized RDD family membrane protein YckC
MPGGYGNSGVLLPGAVGPLKIGNRVWALLIDWGAFFVLEIVADVSGSNAFQAVIGLVALILWFVYAYMIGTTGQTYGKRVMGLKVVDANTGQLIGFGRGILRYFVQGLLNIVCFAGLWSPFLDSNSGRYQGWHDKAATTQVISVK